MKRVLDVHEGVQGLIFDIDGTLADNMPIHYLAWQQVVKDLGGTFPESLFYEWAGIPTKVITEMLNEKYGSSMAPLRAVVLKEKYYIERMHLAKPIEPVVNIVYQYHNKLPLSCGTGGKREIALKTIKNLGLENYFEAIVTAEDVTNHKPAPDTFLLCAEKMKVKPEHCQVFEDGEQGLEAARRAGMAATDIRPYMPKKNI